MRELLFLLLVLACPLAMIVMMRGGHGHGGHTHARDADEIGDMRVSTEELRRRRAALDRWIEEREASGSEVDAGEEPLASRRQ